MEQIFFSNKWLILLLILWILPWKGVALWKAARRREKWWFIVILVINTLAILEIIYLFVWCRKQPRLQEKSEGK